MDELKMKKLNSGRQYRKIDVPLTIRKKDADNKIVEGYATTFDSEYELWTYDKTTLYESIDSRAFDDCDMSDVIMQFDHEGFVYARSRNNTLKLEIDKHGLKVVADLGGTERGRALYEDISKGYIDRMSFGFTLGQTERTVSYDEETGKREVHVRITKIKKLYDVSAVSIPANDMTELSSRSLFDGVIKELEAERMREEKRKKRLKLIIETELN
jgi:HK97 family phage prohead protease